MTEEDDCLVSTWGLCQSGIGPFFIPRLCPHHDTAAPTVMAVNLTQAGPPARTVT